MVVSRPPVIPRTFKSKHTSRQGSSPRPHFQLLLIDRGQNAAGRASTGNASEQLFETLAIAGAKQKINARVDRAD